MNPSLPMSSATFEPGARRMSASGLWRGWRWRVLAMGVLLGCLGWGLLIQHLAQPLQIEAQWQRSDDDQIELVSTPETLLKPYVGRTVIAMTTHNAAQAMVAPDAQALQRSARWLVHDVDRAQHLLMHAQLAEVIGQSDLGLLFDNGELVYVPTHALGWSGLPAMFWLVSPLAFALYVVALGVFLAKLSKLNALYALMSLCQAGNLLFISVESALRLGLPPHVAQLDLPLRMAFDLVTAAAVVHAACMHPNPLRHGRWVATGAWASVALLLGLNQAALLDNAWWWTQGACTLLGILTMVVLTLSYRTEPHPFAIVLRRFVVIAIVTWVLLSLAVAASASQPELQHGLAGMGAITWYVFLAALLLLVPFLSRSQQVMREFALLAAMSTVAMSLNLLFVAVFSLGQFASFALALFLSIGVYIGSRQWLVNQLLGSSLPSAERMFERLYRVAREVEEHPDRTPRLLSGLLQELFEPLELRIIRKTSSAARVVADGSTLLLPIPTLSMDPTEERSQQSMILRFAHRGRRLFTSEDVRLTDRIIEQLCRAVAFDQAVEQGRNEERSRLAQDLHDDIGARLLTLMYTAPSPEIEEYARHTLQDLKTLTRGLAASNHRLSYAAAEWKSDLTQRLSAAHIELGWKFEFDADTQLNVVQWSALTRILRELINNVIAHASARRVDVHFRLFNNQMELRVTDNGVGHSPQNWSHGLGLGGIRKRAKQLGAEVEWQEAAPRGISCCVVSRQWARRL